jgi:hypothetical protein
MKLLDRNEIRDTRHCPFINYSLLPYNRLIYSRRVHVVKIINNPARRFVDRAQTALKITVFCMALQLKLKLKPGKISPPNRPSKPVKSQQGPSPETDLLTPIHTPPEIHRNDMSHHIAITFHAKIEYRAIPKVCEIT